MSGKQVTIIGVGLLGGSIGMALRRKGLASPVVGHVRNEARLDRVVERGAVDRATRDLGDAVGDAAIIVLCTPPGSMPGLVERILPRCPEGVLVTDVGSVKRRVIEGITGLEGVGRIRFVGSHPMAGGEKGGVERARASLLEGAVCAMTPTEETPEADRHDVRRFWESLGSRVVEMDPQRHDRIVATASHLPHIIASLLALQVLEPEGDGLRESLAATGFGDTTRIAGGDSALWQDVLSLNADFVGEALGDYIRRLSEFRRHLDRSDYDRVIEVMEGARRLRRGWEENSGCGGR